LSSTLYDDALDGGLVLIRPKLELAIGLEELIVKQLKNQITVLDRADFRSIVANFIEDNMLDAVILGCTELPVIFGNNMNPRIIDTLEVLSEGLLRAHFNQMPLLRLDHE
jgi:aspartate/glutamate racemase